MAQQPAGSGRISGQDVLLADGARDLDRQFEIATREQCIFCRQFNVVFDEVGVGDTVTVGEDQVLALARHNRLVHHLAFLETVVLLPDVLDGNINL